MSCYRMQYLVALTEQVIEGAPTQCGRRVPVPVAHVEPIAQHLGCHTVRANPWEAATCKKCKKRWPEKTVESLDRRLMSFRTSRDACTAGQDRGFLLAVIRDN
jgi:hypothetical protein